MGRFVFGAAMTILAFLGLFMASRAEDPVYYLQGLLLFVFGVGFVFYLISASVAPKPKKGPAEEYID